MFELGNVHNQTVYIFAETIENEAISQISNMANSPLGKDAHIAIMPDAHAGAGCTIGTTMKIHDKVCPNLVGVDVSCGVSLSHIAGLEDVPFDILDSVIRNYVPHGTSVHEKCNHSFDFSSLRCWNMLRDKTKDRALRSMGTLGGGEVCDCHRTV